MIRVDQWSQPRRHRPTESPVPAPGVWTIRYRAVSDFADGKGGGPTSCGESSSILRLIPYTPQCSTSRQTGSRSISGTNRKFEQIRCVGYCQLVFCRVVLWCLIFLWPYSTNRGERVLLEFHAKIQVKPVQLFQYIFGNKFGLSRLNQFLFQRVRVAKTISKIRV